MSTDCIDRVPSPTPPAPPPKSDPSPPPGYSWEKPLPRIDPLMASKYKGSKILSHISPADDGPDRPFMQAAGSNNDDAATSNQSPPYGGLQRSNTIPIPSEPPSPDWENGIPAFPLPRSMSDRRPGALASMKPLGSAPPISIPHSPYTATDQGPMSARSDKNRELPLPPPPPLPKDDDVTPLPEAFHKRGDSVDSRSSYGTASIQYDNGSKRSTMVSSRRPSFGSVVRDPHAFLDDGFPGMRPAPLETLTENPSYQESELEDTAHHNEQHDSAYSGFDFGIPAEKNNREAAIHRPSDSEQLNLSSFHSHSESSSGQLFSQRSPHQSSHSPAPSVDRFRDSREPFTCQYHGIRQPSGSNHYLHPGNLSIDEGNRRKNSDASEGGNSLSNFARALGLDDGEHYSTESSTVSSEFSPSESRSGTSLSSLPSETSLSRRKASEASRLGPVVEENQYQYEQPSPTTRHPMLEEASQSGSPLEPPKIPNFLQAPDSPTDPALSQGSLSLVSGHHSPRSEDSMESPSTDSPVSPAKERPAAIAIPPPRQVARSKGRCRGCGEAILGKSVSSADGRLTGRYHRDCFACCYCRIPFQTADFYVLDNKPYCAQHYHELNGSLCSTCNTGIEGQYLETEERTGRGPSDRRKFHPECLTCRTCNINLKGEYFEWNGQVYCERDARRAAASVPPPRFRRPTMPSSPLSRPLDPYGPPGPMGPMGRPFPPGPGRRPPPMGPPMGPDLLGPPGAFGPAYGPAYGPPPGAKRFPERRTTRLMMI